MKASRNLVATIVLIMVAHAQVHAISWTEKFDTGVGLLNSTVGNGATDFVYNGTNQNLDASFVRNTTSNARFAVLGSAFTENSIATMSVEITPLSVVGGGRPRLGFFDSSTGDAIIWVELDNAPLPGRIGPLHIGKGDSATRTEFEFSSLQTWDFNETYLLEVALNGLTNEVSLSASILNGSSFDLLQTESFNFGALTFSFDAVGIGNVNDTSGESAGNPFTALIDNVSFSTPDPAMVPEPATATLGLLALGGLMMRRGRMA